LVQELSNIRARAHLLGTSAGKTPRSEAGTGHRDLEFHFLGVHDASMRPLRGYMYALAGFGLLLPAMLVSGTVFVGPKECPHTQARQIADE
jgi:hypothetical protein